MSTNIVLLAFAESQNFPTHKFFLVDGERLPSDNEFKQIYDGQVAQLVIDEVFLDDSGHYKIIAKNASGEVSSECDLSVKSKDRPCINLN